MSELNDDILDEVEDGNSEDVTEDDIRDSLVITVPIDSTLSISGAAADARATGQALNTKASESDVKTLLSVNGRTGSGNWAIMVNGGNIPASSDADTEMVSDALERIDGALTTEQQTRSQADTALDGRLDALEAKKIVLVSTTFTSDHSKLIPVTGITADHELIGYQFVDSSSNPTGDILADLAWTTGAGSIQVTISNVQAAGSVRMIFGVPEDITPEEVES